MSETFDTDYAPFDALPSNASAEELASAIGNLIAAQSDRDQAVATTANAYTWLARQAEQARGYGRLYEVKDEARHTAYRDAPHYLVGMLRQRARQGAA